MTDTTNSHRTGQFSAGTEACITVRAAAGQLRVIPVWQTLGQHATCARRVRIHCSAKHGFEEMTVIFDSVSPGTLTDIARRLRAQQWVVETAVR